MNILTLVDELEPTSVHLVRDSVPCAQCTAPGYQGALAEHCTQCNRGRRKFIKRICCQQELLLIVDFCLALTARSS